MKKLINSGGEANIYLIQKNNKKYVHKKPIGKISLTNEIKIRREIEKRVGNSKRIVNHEKLFEKSMYLEYFPSETIEERFSKTQKRDRRLKIMLKMAFCIFILHKNGIIHGDVSPANFLIERGLVKITDFSHSVVGDITNNYVSLTAFSSPETRFLRETPSKASDIFSLGLVFAKMENNFPSLEFYKDYYDLKFSNRIGIIIEKMCRFEPEERIGINEVIKRLNNLYKTRNMGV